MKILLLASSRTLLTLALLVGGTPRSLAFQSSLEAFLQSTVIEASDDFGMSVAVSGNTAVVGAPREDSSATGVNGDAADNGNSSSGAAYVFVRSGSSWTQQAYLKASNTGYGDNFGSAVAIWGDTIVVSANEEDSAATGLDGDQADNSADRAGAAYVFERVGGIWTQTAYLKASNTDSGDQFGSAVAIHEDTIVVSAPREASGATTVDGDGNDNSAPDAGAAYVFARGPGEWTQQAYLKASNAEAYDNFGVAVSVFGDSVAVGAPSEWSASTGVNGDETDNTELLAGAAYVFDRVGTTWSQVAYVKASNTERADRFGRSVSLSGDRLVVGAPEEDSGATGVDGDQNDESSDNAGAAYMFLRDGAGWSQIHYIKASNTGPNDAFGQSASLSGKALLVAAPKESSDATGVDGDGNNDNLGLSGAAYVFLERGSTWVQQAYLKSSAPGNFDLFGTAAALSADTVVVGVPHEGPLGGAYVFTTGSPPCQTFCTSLPNATGLAAQLSCSGAPLALTITSSPVPNTPGQFFFGPMMLAGNPFGDGLLCVGGTVTRIPGFVHAGMMMQLPNSATLTVDYGAPYAAGLSGALHFQHWFRSGLNTGSGFNTSNGLSISF